MSKDQAPDGLSDVTVIRPRLQSKADAKRLLRLCAEVPEAWKGYNTTAGFVLEADYQRARAIFDGIRDPDPGAPKRHDWPLIEALTRDIAQTESNRTVIRFKVAESYAHSSGRHLSPDSGTFKAKVREWLGRKS